MKGSWKGSELGEVISTFGCSEGVGEAGEERECQLMKNSEMEEGEENRERGERGHGEEYIAGKCSRQETKRRERGNRRKTPRDTIIKLFRKTPPSKWKRDGKEGECGEGRRDSGGQTHK